MMYEGSQIEERKDTITNKDGKAWCVECQTRSRYAIGYSTVKNEVLGVKFNYIRMTPFCVYCGNEVYVKEIHDANVHAKELAYKEAKK